MLGNGCYTPPDGVPYEYEAICESCPCFSTTVEFLSILNKQKQDTENKRQTAITPVNKRAVCLSFLSLFAGVSHRFLMSYECCIDSRIPVLFILGIEIIDDSTRCV